LTFYAVTVTVSDGVLMIYEVVSTCYVTKRMTRLKTCFTKARRKKQNTVEVRVQN